MPLNAVVKWRKDHGAPIDEKDPKWRQHWIRQALRAVQALHFLHAVFRQSFVEYISYHKGRPISDRALDMEGERSGSGLDEKVSKVLEKKKPGALVPLGKEQLEPVLRDMAFLHLKTMSGPGLWKRWDAIGEILEPAHRIKLKTTTHSGSATGDRGLNKSGSRG